MNRTFFLTSLLYLGLVLPAYSADEYDIHSGNHQSLQDLSGTWLLDQASSDDPMARMKEARGNMQKSMGMRSAMGGGFGRGKGGGMGRSGGSGSQGGMQAGLMDEMRALISGPQVLKLSHQDPVLLITADDRPAQQLFTDYRGATVSASNSGPQAVTTAGWEGDVLIIETTRDGNPTLLQRYRLNAGTGQLEIITDFTLPGSSRQVSIKYFYDRADTLEASALDAES